MFYNYTYDPNDATERHSFEIHDIDIAYINGIRRTILTDIPVIGISGEEDTTVDIIVNTGPLHNEIISHRIGLIPLNFSEEDTEKFDDNITYQFELNVKNDTNNIENIETDKITGKKNDVALTKQELAKIFPPNIITKDHILITKLRTGEHLHLLAKTVKKTARFNASFSPVSLCNFYYMQNPEKAEKVDSVLDKERAFHKNKYGDANKIMFEIEPVGNLQPKYLVNKAIEIIIEKLNNLRNNITLEDNDNTVIIKKFNELESTYDFDIADEDDTLGNIIQSYIHNKYIRQSSSSLDSKKCTYVGYICPHPLKQLLRIRITLEDEANKSSFISFLETNCRIIIEDLLKIKSEWNKFLS